MEPLSPGEQARFVDTFAWLLGHPDERARAAGKGVLTAVFRMARFADAPNVAFPVFPRVPAD